MFRKPILLIATKRGVSLSLLRPFVPAPSLTSRETVRSIDLHPPSVSCSHSTPHSALVPVCLFHLRPLFSFFSPVRSFVSSIVCSLYFLPRAARWHPSVSLPRVVDGSSFLGPSRPLSSTGSQAYPPHDSIVASLSGVLSSSSVRALHICGASGLFPPHLYLIFSVLSSSSLPPLLLSPLPLHILLSTSAPVVLPVVLRPKFRAASLSHPPSCAEGRYPWCVRPHPLFELYLISSVHSSPDFPPESVRCLEAPCYPPCEVRPPWCVRCPTLVLRYLISPTLLRPSSSPRPANSLLAPARSKVHIRGLARE